MHVLIRVDHHVLRYIMRLLPHLQFFVESSLEFTHRCLSPYYHHVSHCHHRYFPEKSSLVTCQSIASRSLSYRFPMVDVLLWVPTKVRTIYPFIIYTPLYNGMYATSYYCDDVPPHSSPDLHTKF